MKKLLLYLMALLAFGTLSVDSFAAPFYMLVPSAGNSWDKNQRQLYSGNYAMKENVLIGSGKFAIGVLDQGTNKISWYGPATGVSDVIPVNQAIQLELIASGVSSSVTAATISSSYGVMSVEDGVEGQTYGVEFNRATNILTILADYSEYRITYKNAGNNWAQTQANLQINGDAMFEFKSGDSEVFNMWFTDPDGSTYRFPINSVTFTNGVYSSTFDALPNPDSSNDSAFNSTTSIGGLEKNAYYKVNVNFLKRTLKIQKQPTSLYLRGNMNSWDNVDGTNGYAQDKWRLKENSEGLFVIHTTISNSQWFAIQEGKQYTDNERKIHQYRIDAASAGFNGQDFSTFPVEGNAVVNTGQDQGSMHYSGGDSPAVVIKVKLGDDNKPEYIWIDKDYGRPDTFENYSITTYYRNDAIHTCRNTYVDENGTWYTFDDGRQNVTPAEGVTLDGLQLGYDKFCLRTNSPGGSTQFWGLENANGGIIPGQTYTLKSFSNQNDAKNNTYIASENTDTKVNSRYNILWNWNDNTLTVTLNQTWAESPNQMYLYKVDAEDLDENGYASNISFEKVKELANQNSDKVFVFDLIQDGLYEHNFSKDEINDLPKDTKFVILGRTGTLYNIAGEEGKAYHIEDGWDLGSTSYRLMLTNSDSQLPAIVDTETMASMDCVARIRANFSDENNLQNNYVITFTPVKFAPETFVLKDNQEGGEEVVFTKKDSDTYTISGQALLKGHSYSIYGKADNTEVQYGLNGDEGYSSKAEVDVELTEGTTGSLTIAGDQFKDGSEISLEWNNGYPRLIVRYVGKEVKVKVYFIDRAGWGNVKVYNYSDQNLTQKNDGSGKWNETTDYNKAWPGADMDQQNVADIINNVAGINESDRNVYVHELTVVQYPDGSYARPKVIFNNGNGGNDNQTFNLYLVDGGIYCNNGKNTDGIVIYPATTYLPRLQYTYMDNGEDTEVLAYPNEFYDTDYNYIYVDVPEFTKWVEENKKSVAVSISYDRNGNGIKDFFATGIPGTHKMQLVTIGKKTLLRVALASDVVPNGTEVNLSFWPLENGFDQEVDDYEKEGHNSGAETTDCTYDGHHYTGNHFLCKDAYCSLNFTNVEYKDGNVYRRYSAPEGGTQDPILHIKDLVKADLYIVPVDINEFKNAQENDCLAASPVKVGNFENCYLLTKTDANEPNKVNYLLPDITAHAQFYVVADFGDNDVRSYSGLEPTEMLINNPYKWHSNQTNNYSINQNGIENIKTYQLHISWTDGEVMVTANKINADFKFVERAENGDLISRFNHGLLLPAHTDQCTEDHLTKIYFTYASGYDNDIKNGDQATAANSRLGKLQIELRRNAEFDKYFANGINKQAEIIKRTKLDNRTDKMLVGPYIAIEEYSTDNTPGLAYIYVRAYTASIFTLHMAQTEEDDEFHRSGIDVPVRVYPTFESIGLTINNFTINEETEFENANGEVVKLTPLGTDSETNRYTLNLSHEGHTSTGSEGTADFKDRLHIQCVNADSKYVKYFWCEDPDKIEASSTEPNRNILRAASETINSVVSNTEYGKTNLLSDVNSEPFGSSLKSPENRDMELSAYSIYNAPSVPIDKNGQATNSKSIYLQLSQNGIKSPAYALDLNRTPNIPTEVEEILGADNDAEAEYYNLNGVKVDGERLEPGIYVKVQGTKSEKIYIR